MTAGSGRLVARHRRPPERGLPARPGRLRAHAVPAVHLGHHRPTQGHHPYLGGLPPGHQLQPRDGVRHQARRRLLVRRRHRLGDRSQLHRLRAAGQRDHGRDVRGRARHPGLGPLVADRRGLQGHGAVHGADRDPGLHEAGRGAPREARPVLAAPAGLGGRAHQPRGVAVVPPQRRSGALSHRRHLVADGDGPDRSSRHCRA